LNNSEIIRSYLVSLGFEVNQPELAKFDRGLNAAAKTVAEATSGIAKSMLGWQSAIIGAFTSVGFGVLGLIDKISDSEIGFQNFAVQMMMSTDAAKKMKIATDVLGASIDEIAWNPELLRQYKDIQALEDNMQSGLNREGYKSELQDMFRLNEQFKLLRVELTYLSEGLAAGLFKAIDGKSITDRLQGIVDWIQNHGPEITGFVSQQIAPAFEDWKRIAAEVGQTIGDTTLVFSNLINTLSGDDKFTGTALKVENVAHAFQHVVSTLDGMVEWLTRGEDAFVHFAGAATIAMAGVEAALEGNMSKARELFSLAGENFKVGEGVAKSPIRTFLTSGAAGPVGYALDKVWSAEDERKGVQPQPAPQTGSLEDYIIKAEGHNPDGGYGEYSDISGHRTVGYGHLVKHGEDFSAGVSKEQALELLRKDIAHAQDVVKRLVSVALTGNQRSALTDFVFNEGEEHFKDSTLLKDLNSGDYAGAANQFEQWNKIMVKGHEFASKVLTGRRFDEENLFNTPDSSFLQYYENAQHAALSVGSGYSPSQASGINVESLTVNGHSTFFGGFG
jgi:GH24 family phage-related lysozyme (muramidase)